MRSAPRSVLAAGALIASLVLSTGAAGAAFHDGGVANCGGCHVTHGTADGLAVEVGEQLLRAETASDTCLLCHASGPWSALGPSVISPSAELGAGDFVFLLEDELNDAVQARGPSRAGEEAGHSIVAPGYGLVADSRSPTAPGGSFRSAELGCTSCHDPHGTAAFRMLAGVGPVQGGAYSFSRPAPEADGIDAGASAVTERPTAHTAYRSGWTAWCGNCHGDRVHDDGAHFEHPVDEALGSEIAKRYADYGGDASPASGDPASAYLPEVPFADSFVSPTSTAGPSATSRLNCMTCHRAHASSAPDAGRWDFRVPTLGDDGGLSGSYPLPNPYGNPDQRQLCVKCHDTEGHDVGRSCHSCHGSAGRDGPPIPDPFEE